MVTRSGLTPCDPRATLSRGQPQAPAPARAHLNPEGRRPSCSFMNRLTSVCFCHTPLVRGRCIWANDKVSSTGG